MNITLPLIFGLALGVSALSAQVPPNARTGDSDARLTVIGCIQRSAPSPAATTGTTAIPAGETKYVLSNITLSADPSPASPAESAARAMSEAVKMYRLDDSADSLIAPHVGDRVEVTGTLRRNPPSPTGTTGTTREPSANEAANAPLLRVDAVRKISSGSATCSQ